MSQRPLLDIHEWGPSAWNLLIAAALTSPIKFTPKDRLEYKTFYESLPPIMPCPMCGHHFSQNLPVPETALHGRETLFQWIVNIHNDVNRRSNKRVLSYDEVKFRYFHWHNKDGSTWWQEHIHTILIVVATIVLVTLFRRTRRK